MLESWLFQVDGFEGYSYTILKAMHREDLVKRFLR